MLFKVFVIWSIFLIHAFGECNDKKPDSPEVAKQICPTDNFGNDIIQCPQTYGDTPGLDRTHSHGTGKEIKEGEDYSWHDRQRLFRPAKNIEEIKKQKRRIDK